MLDIRTFPDPVLRKRSEKVLDIDEETLVLVENMIETMDNVSGVGLAAPQIGEPVRVIVINNPADTKSGYALFNPEIISAEGEQVCEEGCLSIPGLFVKVKRAKSVLVTASSSVGETLTFKAGGREAQILQHEIDHLDGLLFWDRIGKAKRDLVRKRYIKKLRAAAADVDADV